MVGERRGRGVGQGEEERVKGVGGREGRKWGMEEIKDRERMGHGRGGVHLCLVAQLGVAPCEPLAATNRLVRWGGSERTAGSMSRLSPLPSLPSSLPPSFPPPPSLLPSLSLFHSLTHTYACAQAHVGACRRRVPPGLNRAALPRPGLKQTSPAARTRTVANGRCFHGDLILKSNRPRGHPSQEQASPVA